MKRARKPRLCLLLPSHWAGSMGGAEFQARLLVERLAELDLFDLHYIARSVSTHYSPRGYTLHRITTAPRIGGVFFPDAPQLWRLLHRVQPDIVYQRVGCAYTGVAAFYARTTAARMVWHISSDRDVTPLPARQFLRTPLEGIDKWLVEYGARNANAVVVQSKEQARLLQRHYGRQPAALVPNFHPRVQEKLARANSPMRICWIANMKPLKRPELFLRLARELRHLPAEFIMVGSMMPGHAGGAELDAQIRAQPNLRHLGVLPVKEVDELLAGAHLLVNTSEYEGFSNAFIQAWLREVPVVSLAVNPDGVFDDERYGICADGSYDVMHSAIERLATDGDLRATMGRRCREFATETFSIGNLDRLLPVLDPQFAPAMTTGESTTTRPVRRASL